MKHRHLPNEENAFKNFHFQRQIRIPCLNTFYVFFYTFYYCLLVVSFPGYFFFFFFFFFKFSIAEFPYFLLTFVVSSKFNVLI